MIDFNVSHFEKAIKNAMLGWFAFYVENQELKKKQFDNDINIDIESKDVSKDTKDKLYQLKAITQVARLNGFVQDRREKILRNKEIQRKIEKDFKQLIKFMKSGYPDIYKYCIEIGKLNDDILSFNKEYIKKWATHHQNTEGNTKEKTTQSKTGSTGTKEKETATTTRKKTARSPKVTS